MENTQEKLVNTTIEEKKGIPIPEAKNPNNKYRVVIIVMGVIIFILTTALVYVFTQNKSELETSEGEDTQVVEEEESEQEEETDGSEEVVEENEVVELNEYYNEEFGVKFSYPTDWVILEDREEGDMALKVKVGKSISASEEIFLYEIVASEIDKCIYSEDELKVSDGPTYEILYDNYVDIGTEGIYRRSYDKYGEYDSWIICKKGEDGIYRRFSPGFITYWNVDNTDQKGNEVLKILDGILLSYEYTGEKY